MFEGTCTTGTEPNRRTTYGQQNDGISIIVRIIHYHCQQGYHRKHSATHYFNFCFGAFVNSDPMKACASIREELRVAIRLGIKVSYDSTLRRCAEMIQRRGPSFHEPMRSWTTCPDPRYENDCLQLFDAFLADVERVTRHTQDTLIDLKDQDSLQAHAMHVSTVGRPWTTRAADKPKREGNPSPPRTVFRVARR